VQGKPAPAPYAFDPTNGVQPDGPPFPDGADRGKAEAQPTGVMRFERAEFRWSGGQRGYDRPVDAAFVTIQRRAGRHWHHVTNDLGLQIIWSVDQNGLYSARWEVPLSQRTGSYRFVVTAKKYHLASKPFRVGPASNLQATGDGRLRYPAPVVNQDITYRPEFASHPRRVKGRLTDRYGNSAP
jgi:hypothetical protein